MIDRRKRTWNAWASVGPGILWLILFFAIPLAIIAGISFFSRGEDGTVDGPLTWENYRRLAGFGLLGFDPLYPFIVLRSLGLGLGTALLCLLAGLPLAFFMARLPRTYKTLALTLVVIPLWTNLLIRTYAWQMLLGPDSWPSRLAVGLGMLGVDEGLSPGTFAVYLCMVCDFLPFMVLPVYASVEKLDWSLAEAAMDLGANRFRVFLHGILPQIRPGMVAGLTLVSLPATGQFVIPDLLGGAKTVMLGNAVQQQFGPGLDWPFGSAIAVASLVIVMTGVWFLARRSDERDLELL